jgi:hypothetical protein
VSAGVFAAALLQLSLMMAVGWALGNLVLDRLVDEERTTFVGPPERALAAVAGAILFCVGSMALHIVGGGVVFGVPGLVPLAALATTFVCRRHLVLGGPVPWAPLAAGILLVAAIYLTPALLGGSSIRTGDPPWHLGWSNQLLAGEPVPTGPAPEFGRNAYPWGLHAVMATAVRLAPGSTALTALEMLHLLLVVTIPLGAACLARRIKANAGWAAAAAASLVGGFGWIRAAGADFVTSPGNSRYGADLVVASPNSVYELFPPALPRELGLVMLAAAGWLTVVATGSRRHNVWVAVGVAAGLVGLLSVPLFVTALLWIGGAAWLVPRGGRLRWLTVTGLSAVAVFALWAGPVASHAIRYGGFVNITPRLGKEWPLLVAFASWGLLLPLAVGGFILSLKARVGRALSLLAACSFGLLLIAITRGQFDWDLAGNATLLHQGRAWPPAHLLGAVFAGIGLLWLWERARERSRALATVALTVLVGIGAASPVLASQRLSEIIRGGGAGFEYGGEDLSPGSFARRAAAFLDPHDIVDVRGNEDLAFLLFQLSGAKLADFDDPRLDGNDLRIRYAELAAAYDRTVDAGGFEATYLVIPAPAGAYERALARGSFQGRDWILVQLND